MDDAPGQTLLEGGRLLDSDPAAAADKAREVLAADSSNPAGFRLLGAALRRLGDAEQANEAELAAIAASVNDPDLIRARDAMVAGDLPAAEPILRQILAQRPNDVVAMRMLGEIAALNGFVRDAEALYRRALQLAPGFEFARLHLAMALHDQNRAGEALAELDKMTGELVEHEETKALRASASARVGEYAQAIELYRELVALNPNNLEAWSSLAFLYKTIGQPDQVVEACRSALAASPNYGEAWWMLADLKTYKFSDADVAALEEAIASPGLSDNDRLRLHFALGKALEDRKQAEASFDHYQRGNELRAAQVRHNPDRITQLVERTEKLFTSEFLAAHAGNGDPAPDPIFVLGMPRSGSTLIEQILASHPMIEGTAELPDIHILARSLEPNPHSRAGWERYPQVLAELTADQLAELGRLYLDRTRVQRKTERPHFIDKMPNNWPHVGFIQLILPNAKIIDARRHPLACGFSNFKQLYARGQEFSYALEHFGLHYRDYVRLMAHFDRVAPGRIHRVIHEQLVQDPEQEIRRLLDYVGVPFDEACLSFHETKRPVRSASAEQVRQPIRADAVEEWRAFEPYLGPMKDALGPALSDWDKGPNAA
jgi:tetratricopeptide (TPR) repeat protein